MAVFSNYEEDALAVTSMGVIDLKKTVPSLHYGVRSAMDRLSETDFGKVHGYTRSSIKCSSIMLIQSNLTHKRHSAGIL